MSNFRSKTSEIVEKGKAERGNFEPHGAPLRLYNYWLRNSGGKKAKEIRTGRRRENFCHFWRVVAIWAPLMWLLNKGEKVVTSKAFGVFLAVAVVALIVWAGMTSADFLVILTFVALGLVGLAVVIGIILTGVWAKRKYWKSEWNDLASKIAIGIWVTVVTIYLGTWLVIGFMDVGWILAVYIIGGLIAFAAVILGLHTLSDYISGKRALAKAKRDAAREALEAERRNWTYDQWQEYYRKPAPRTPSKFERKIAAFFSGLADFLIFAFQIVRVKKWKICPMVNVNVK